MSEYKLDRCETEKGHFYILSDNAGHEVMLHFREDESIKHFLCDVVEQVNAAIKGRATIEARLVTACEAAIDVLKDSAYSPYIRVVAMMRAAVEATKGE